MSPRTNISTRCELARELATRLIHLIDLILRVTMDPLTALGIACNVMQILSFSHEIFTLARRIAHDGSPDASLADKSAHLSDLSEDLQGSLKKQQETKHLTKQQQCLQKVAKKCLGSAKDLAEELDNIKWKPGPSGSNSKAQRRLLSQTWKAWWGKSKIDNLEKEMTQAEQAMQSTMLSELWYETIPLMNVGLAQALVALFQ